MSDQRLQSTVQGETDHVAARFAVALMKNIQGDPNHLFTKNDIVCDVLILKPWICMDLYLDLYKILYWLRVGIVPRWPTWLSKGCHPLDSVRSPEDVEASLQRAATWNLKPVFS